ncbi:MAG TPA: PBP1A family penicillin-binding protein [Candidatus Obscuribacterales bacterium]
MAQLRYMNTGEQARSRLQAAGLFLKAAFLVVSACCAAATAYLGVGVWLQLQNVPDIASLESYDRGDPIQIFDRYDHLIYSFKGEENRRRVTLDNVSPHMKVAVLAAEDHNFYQHQGVNPTSVVRAFLSNLQARRVVEGGSTITQQLVKNLFFEQPKRTLERKIAEAAIAFELEKRYSKDQILEMYLNEAYFGNGAYGIEQASRYYFAKPASRLNLAESAFLAGLIKSPSRLGDPAHRNSALQQQLDVLDRMVKYGFTTRLGANFASHQPLVFYERKEQANVQVIPKYPYFISYVIDLVRQRFSPSDMRRHGLRVYTSLDPVAQEIAESSLRRGIAAAPAGITQGALATVSVKDGSIIALVGGVGSYEESQFNRATHPHTVGSAFKPFVYLTALEQGIITQESFLDDTPLVVKQPGSADWSPKNFDGKFLGRITARDALVFSRNVCAVRVAQMVGIPSIVETARRAGITEPLDANLSLALGSSAVSPLELAGAYATFARDGLIIRPWVLRRVENKRGHVIRAYDQPVSRAFGPEVTTELVDMLREVVTRGTGTEARIRNLFVAGKTGTSDQARDLWFVGFTPDLVTAIWGGNDANQPVSGAHVTGGTVMAGIWKSYTQALYGNASLARSGLIRLAGTVDRKHESSRTATRAPYLPPYDDALDASSGPRPQQQHQAPVPQPPPAKVVLKKQQARMDLSGSPPSKHMDYSTPPPQDSIRLRF